MNSDSTRPGRAPGGRDEPADHYALLGLDRTADEARIRAAVAHQLRRWNTRASSSPSLEARQRAESRVAQLNRAKRELLDPDLRAAYDKRLAGGPEPSAGTTGEHRSAGRTEQRADRTPPPRTEVRRPAGAWLDRAWDSVGEHRYEDALYEAQRATDASPRNAGAWLLLGWLRWKKRDLDGARLAHRTAIRLAPTDPRPHMELGDVHRYQGALPAARAEYRRAAELAPDSALYRQAVEDADRDILRRTRAAALVEQNRHREALDVYLALTEHSYGDRDLHNSIGRCMSVVANGFKHYPPDGTLPYIPSRTAAAEVKEWAEAALSYELTDERLVKKLREDIHYADMVLERLLERD